MVFLSLASGLSGLSHGVNAMASWFLPIIYGALGALPSLLILFSDLERAGDHLKSATKYKERTNVYDFIVGKLCLYMFLEFRFKFNCS